jgi:hypothetical protein
MRITTLRISIKCHNAQCVLFIVMLSVTMLNVIPLSIIMLPVVIPSVIILNVVAPASLLSVLKSPEMKEVEDNKMVSPHQNFFRPKKSQSGENPIKAVFIRINNKLERLSMASIFMQYLLEGITYTLLVQHASNDL